MMFVPMARVTSERPDVADDEELSAAYLLFAGAFMILIRN